MAMAWFGWAQEDPPRHWQVRLGIGSALGLLLAGVFGYSVFMHWDQNSVLEGHYEWFGLLVGFEVLLAGAGCFYLWRKDRRRWMAWWVALVVALHFFPLALLLQDISIALLGLLQAGLLVPLTRRLGGHDWTTSRIVGPLMGVSFLAFAGASTGFYLLRTGLPW
ncbi:hypothetical protein GCM10009672_22060 [Nesterenkonia lutea]